MSVKHKGALYKNIRTKALCPGCSTLEAAASLVCFVFLSNALKRIVFNLNSHTGMSNWKIWVLINPQLLSSLLLKCESQTDYFVLD